MLETSTNTLIERVDSLLESDRQPLLATSPTLVWIHELAVRHASLEKAVREIALELHKLTAREF